MLLDPLNGTQRKYGQAYISQRTPNICILYNEGTNPPKGATPEGTGQWERATYVPVHTVRIANAWAALHISGTLVHRVRSPPTQLTMKRIPHRNNELHIVSPPVFKMKLPIRRSTWVNAPPRPLHPTSLCKEVLQKNKKN